MVIEGLDPEISELVYLLNDIPGVKTVESCWGHGERPCTIWLRIDGTKNLTKFVFNYLNADKSWELVIDNADYNRNEKEIPLLLRTTSNEKEVVLFRIKDLVQRLKKEV